MIILQNEHVTAKINEMGAELKSMVYHGTEYIWEGNPAIWGYSCPLLFPICGGLKEDKYVYGGKEYTLPKHGYARTTYFEVERADDSYVIFVHRSSAETKENYPFDYELRVIYTLTEATLKVEYEVANKGDKTMYFSIGSHEGYFTPEGIEDYDIIFPEPQTLNSNLLCGNLIANNTIPVIKDSTVLPLYDKYFLIDALIFRNVNTHTVTLRNRKTGRAVTVNYPDMKNLLLWHKPSSPYLCIEPWQGIGDIVGSSYNLEEKEDIITLDISKTYRNVHSITLS